MERARSVLDVDVERGEAILRDCLQCPDVTSSAYRLLADAVLTRNEPHEARRVLLLGRRRFPRSAPLLLALGRVERDLGHAQAAIATLAEAHRLAPEDEIIDSEYQRLLARFGSEEQQAEARIRPLLREASGRYELDDADGALETLNLAFQRSGDHPRVQARVLHRMALVELGEGRLNAALGRVRRALGYADLPAELQSALLVVRSEALLAKRLYAPAARAGRAAVTIFDDNPFAYANLALAEFRLGRRDAALEAFGQAIEHGLPRHLTYDQLEALGDRMLEDPAFGALVESAWPGARSSVQGSVTASDPQ